MTTLQDRARLAVEAASDTKARVCAEARALVDLDPMLDLWDADGEHLGTLVVFPDVEPGAHVAADTIDRAMTTALALVAPAVDVAVVVADAYVQDTDGQPIESLVALAVSRDGSAAATRAYVVEQDPGGLLFAFDAPEARPPPREAFRWPTGPPAPSEVAWVAHTVHVEVLARTRRLATLLRPLIGSYN